MIYLRYRKFQIYFESHHFFWRKVFSIYYKNRFKAWIGSQMRRVILWFYFYKVPLSRFSGDFLYEMRWKKIMFTAYFLHLFVVNTLNRCELFIFTAFYGILTKKRNFRTRFRASYLLLVNKFLLNCRICYFYPIPNTKCVSVLGQYKCISSSLLKDRLIFRSWLVRLAFSLILQWSDLGQV